ncbi:hypothetical protein NL676_005679 [Syzygium grande]|nr:hypothetical protein NL676_005679 [Syzygium grande]
MVVTGIISIGLACFPRGGHPCPHPRTSPGETISVRSRQGLRLLVCFLAAFPRTTIFARTESAVIAEVGRDEESDRKRQVLKELYDVEASARHMLEAID